MAAWPPAPLLVRMRAGTAAAAFFRPRRCSLPSPLLLVTGAAAAYGRSVGRRTGKLRRRRPKSCPTSASAVPAKAVAVGHQKLLVSALRYPRRLRLQWEGGSAKGSKGRHVGLSWSGRARGGSGRRPPPWEMKVARTRLLFSGDCHGTKGEKDMCVVGGINNYTAALQDSSSPYNRTESLLFLSHFLGDIHQPMHCGRTADLGGNTIVVTWYNTTKTNLHKVWDEKVIETAMNRFYKDDRSAMIQAIKLNLTNEWSKEENQWAACYTRTTTCADKYAEESAELSCPAYVGAEQGSNLEDEYFFKALPIVEKRIAQGGVRLAAILNWIFSGKDNSSIQSS